MRKNDNDFDQYYQDREPVTAQHHDGTLVRDDSQIAIYLAKVMGWMCLGLLTTLTMAIVTLATPPLRALVFENGIGYMGVFIAQFVLVIAFSAGLRKMNAGMATVCFLLYSALTGVTFSALAVIFQLDSLLFVFGLCALIFFLMAVYGFATKKDLTRMGSLAVFALFGIIIASVFNMLIMKSPMMDLAICCIGVLIFVVLIAYDTQKIKSYYLGAADAGHDDESQEVRKLAIYGAFMLYLDFINLFLRLLQIFGKRRR